MLLLNGLTDLVFNEWLAKFSVEKYKCHTGKNFENHKRQILKCKERFYYEAVYCENMP